MIGTGLLTNGQKAAVLACVERLQSGEWARLEGAAGTGKTFTAGTLIKNLKAEEILGVALSHIAARQLRKRVDFPVCTVASAMYMRVLVHNAESAMALRQLERSMASGEIKVDSPQEEEFRTRVESLMDDRYELNPHGRAAQLTDNDLLLIDEHSMVPPDVLPYLQEHLKCPLLLIGDSFQLPPPGYSDGAFKDIPITYELSEIMRGSGTNIPEIAMLFRRNQARFNDGIIGQFRVTTINAPDREFRLSPKQWADAGRNYDVILAPHHRTRMHVTKNVRWQLFGCGVERPLMRGDRFLIKRRTPLGLEKSMVMTLGRELAFPGKDAFDAPPGFLRLDIVDPDLLEEFWARRAHKGKRRPAELPPEPLYFPISMLEWAYQASGSDHGYDRALKQAEAQVRRFQRLHKGLVNDNVGMVSIVEYGWAVTIHSVQGAEYDRVLTFYPGWGSNPNGLEARRLVYTGITRARKFCHFVRQRGCFG